MKRLLVTVTANLVSLLCFCQSDTVVRYYKSLNNLKEVAAAKATYRERTFSNIDGSVTTETYNLKEQKIESSYTYKGEEPVGIWTVQSGGSTEELDYNFSVNTTDECECKNNYPGLDRLNMFADNDSMGYKAPLIASGENSIYRFVLNNIVYPKRALEDAISGKVYLLFTITEHGKIDCIRVFRSAHITLDKESIRVINLLKLKTPPTVNGQPVKVCAMFPFIFKVD